MSAERTLIAAVLRYADAHARLAARQRTTREDKEMAGKYPRATTGKYPRADDLSVGDVLMSSSGRVYTVSALDGTKVSYAYVPATAMTDKVVIDTRHDWHLTWVRTVTNSKGRRVWPVRAPQKFDKVRYEGDEWSVAAVNVAGDRVDLTRTQRTFSIPIDRVEVL